MGFHTTLSKVEHSYKAVPWTHSADGLLHWGDSVMLRNKKVDGHLAADMGIRENNIDEAYRLNTSVRKTGPISRNVFVLSRVEEADMFGSDSVIRFGQKVRIQANPWLFRKTLSLGSTPKSINVHSHISRLQEASLHANETFNTVWVIDSFDPNDRFERQGEAVRSGEPILFRHCHTQAYLASDAVKEKNDFGTEYEVSCHSFSSQNKTQNLALEKKGQITTDVPTRFQQDQNVWMIETAPDSSYSASFEEL